MSEARVGLIGALLCVVGPISMSLFTPAMPEIVHAFGTTEAAVKLTLSLYFAGFACAQLVCGPLSDGFGRKPVIYAFLAIYLVGSLAAVFAPTIQVLIAARVLQGVGAAAGVAIARAITTPAAEPMPCRMRAMISTSMLGASNAAALPTR